MFTWPFSIFILSSIVATSDISSGNQKSKPREALVCVPPLTSVFPSSLQSRIVWSWSRQPGRCGSLSGALPPGQEQPPATGTSQPRIRGHNIIYYNYIYKHGYLAPLKHIQHTDLMMLSTIPECPWNSLSSAKYSPTEKYIPKWVKNL